MKINERMIPHIERALEIKLLENQVHYLLNDTFLTNERRSGKTVAYCIKLALSEGEPLVINKPEQFADYPYDKRYARSYFKREFLKIRSQLENYGLPVRDIRNSFGPILSKRSNENLRRRMR